ncbi:hypothetical protein [Salipiger thiooxidans]|uniref:hypothetical protein n=1 Tax=Salipiger thiooxidans TaxID=282683 RepID=UPI001CD79791|nr:hypothetical protein [Salipiger thiooxidans]MCA0850075.1 hypothetical protein [Salipiger thiooxidans]
MHIPYIVARQPTAVEFEILDERRRQIFEEGWTEEHDDEHDESELSLAAGVYALSGSSDSALFDRARQDAIRELWPFQAHWFRPTGGRRDLIKAAALIIAEVERRDRAAAKAERKAQP